MNRTAFPWLFSLVCVLASGNIACSAPADDESGTTGENQSALSISWRNALQCDGAHIDIDQAYDRRTQIVVESDVAARYLKGKLESARDNDPFTRPSLSGANKRLRDDKIVWGDFYSGDPRQGYGISESISGGNEIRLDVTKVAWDKEEQPGLFRKVVDLHVRIVRNGYQEMRCSVDNGMGGGYDSYTYCSPTGGGWQEWEIANWIFRGCRNI